LSRYNAEDTIKRISEITSFRGGTGSNEAAPQIRPLLPLSSCSLN
jgi:hypothetical protein